MSIKLGLKNYRRQWLSAVCTICSMAAFLVPLLTLMGVKDGLIEALNRRLLENPHTLELSPVGGGRFAADFFQAVESHPDTAFVIPETRNISASLNLIPTDGESMWVDIAATAAGDPLLKEIKTDPSVSQQEGLEAILLSSSAAEKLNLKTGDRVTGQVTRKMDGSLEAASIDLLITGIIPRHLVSRDIIMARLALMEMTEDYRNGFAVPELGWPGRTKSPGPAIYAGFRLYATSLDGVERLRSHLAQRGVETRTKAEDIEAVRRIDRAFVIIFVVVSLVVSLGALAAMSSNAMDQVIKMRRSLAVLRLLGFNTSSLRTFIMSQAALAGILAALTADALFLFVAGLLNRYFGSFLTMGERICMLSPLKLVAVVALTVVFMIIASAAASVMVSSIEPSEGMRDV